MNSSGCTTCNTLIRQRERYYNSNGYVNQVLCKVCGRCTHCHLQQQLDHILEWDKDNYTIPIVTTVETKDKGDIYNKDWR